MYGKMENSVRAVIKKNQIKSNTGTWMIVWYDKRKFLI